MPESVVLVVPVGPADTGNGLAMRAGMLLETLAEEHAVDVVVVPISGPASVSPWARSLARQVVIVDLPSDPDHSRALTVAQLGDATLRERLARCQPLPERVRRVPPTLADAIAADLGAEADGSTVLAMREYLLPLGSWLARRLRAARFVIDLDDDAEAMLHHLGQVDEAEGYGRIAEAWLGDADVATAASPDEARAMSQRHGHHVDALPNAIRVPRPSAGSSPTDRPGRDKLLFVGNLTYEPNIDAAIRIVDEILPAVRRRRPTATVTLVGRHDGRLDRLADHEGVTLTGQVEDLAPQYAEADVVVAPLRLGAGTRIKVLEAMAHQRPVVATPLAVAGLGLAHGVDVLIADDDPIALAAAIAALLDDDERWRTVTTTAFATVARTHTVEAVAPRVRHLVLGPSVARRRGDDERE